MYNVDRLERLRDLLLLFLAAFACHHNFVAFRDYVFEDSYITYRYAENLASGHGFVFNPGERVLGTSTPLWTLVLAFAGRLGFDVPAAGGFLTALSLSLLALTGAWVLARIGFPNLGVVFAAAVLWGTGEVLLFWGMETAFFSFLLLAAFALAASGRPALAGLVMGLACLTRYDGALFAGVLIAALWLRTRRFPRRAALAASAVVAPWLIFSWLYFGSVLPNTLEAKSRAVGMQEYVAESLPRLEQRFFSPVHRFGIPFGRHRGLFHLLGLALLAPLFLRARRLARKDGFLGVALVYPILLLLGYAAIGPPPQHQWYLIPGMYFVLMLSLAAWGALTERWRLGGAAAASVGLLVFSLGALPSRVREEARVMEGYYYRSKVEAYGILARWINEHDLSDLKLFTREPGYLTYLSRNPVVDGAGLVTRGIRFHGANRTGLREILAAHRPELAVIVDVAGHVQKLKGFSPLYQTRSKALFIRDDVLSDRYESLAADWWAREAPDPDPLSVRHPLLYDFEPGNASGWWGSSDFVANAEPLRTGAGGGTGAFLTTGLSAAGNVILMSPTFRIDFDELAFRFAATGGTRTSAELIVNGQAVRSVDGRDVAPGGILEVRWPVYHWRGLDGVLRFVDRSPDGHLAVDDVASSRYRNKAVFDDFESGAYSARWATGFWQRPRSSKPMVARHGLALISGRSFATSLWARGKMTMASRPFVVERGKMAFRLFDFGGEDTGVTLEVGGDTVRGIAGRGSQRSFTVVWDLAPFAGEEAVLEIVDGDERRGRGIGIDDVLFFDEGPGS